MSKIKEYSHDEYFKIMETWSKSQESDAFRNPKIILVNDRDQPLLSFKYASFKLNNFFDFYQSKFGDGTKIKKTIGVKALDAVVLVDQLKSSNEMKYVTQNYNFSFPKGINDQRFQKVFEFTKFNIITGTNLS